MFVWPGSAAAVFCRLSCRMDVRLPAARQGHRGVSLVAGCLCLDSFLCWSAPFACCGVGMGDGVPSPCQQRCQLDATGESCVSCRRSIKEIAGWPGFSDFEKKAVWNRLLALPPVAQSKRCPRCHNSFSCGVSGPEQSCWCAALPHIMPLQAAGSDCLCPACLLQAIAQAAAPAARKKD